MTALTCPWCGAPLPPVPPGASTAQCGYCGASAALTGARPVKAQAATAMPALPPRLNDKMRETFEAALEGGANPFDGVREAGRVHLGAMGTNDTFARVVLALAHDLDAESDSDAVHDPKAMGRLMDVYVKAITELRSMASTQINLPFLTLSKSGVPVHLLRELSADVIAELASRDLAPPRPLPPPPPPPEPPKKKGWFW